MICKTLHAGETRVFVCFGKIETIKLFLIKLTFQSRNIIIDFKLKSIASILTERRKCVQNQSHLLALPKYITMVPVLADDQKGQWRPVNGECTRLFQTRPL